MIGKKSKILLIILIFIMVFNFCSPLVLADDMSIDFDDPQWQPYMETAKEVQKESEANGNPMSFSEALESVLKANATLSENVSKQSGDDGGSLLGSVVDFGAGILFYPLKMLAYWFGKAILLITDVAGAGKNETVSPETILFNKLEITNINFFKDTGSSESFSGKLKTNIASWYYTMRTIAIIASLCVLLYIAIRMATSTVASDKAEYKRMLLDWFVGFVLIFVLHYIIILVVNGNNLIVDTLATTISSSESAADQNTLNTYLDKLEDEVVYHVDFSQSLGAIIVYLIFAAITLAFLLMYIKRMIVVAFLIIIAPLITITYSIDKVGDSKSQALDSWLKEFIWTVLIQPFHCVIYVVFVSVAIDSLSTGSLSSSVLAIMCMVFILQAEDIVKKIFGIQADNIGKMSSSFAMGAGAMLMTQKLANKGASKASPIKDSKAGKTLLKGSEVLNKGLTKVNNEKGGIGTGETGGPNSITQKAANAYDKYSAPVKEKLEKFNNWMEDTKPGRAVNAAGKFATGWAKKSYTGASTLVGTALSMPGANGVDDLIKGGFAGYAAGEGLKNAVVWTGKKANIIEAGRTRNAIDNLNNSYKVMRQKTGFSESTMEEKAKVYLKMDLSSEMANQLTDFEKLFAYNLQAMRHQLEKTGQDTSFENVMSKIRFKDIGQEDNKA